VEVRLIDPVIRFSPDLVQVDAAVTDSKGRHVADPRPEDFEILEDGKRQTITRFSCVSAASASETPVPRTFVVLVDNCDAPGAFLLRQPLLEHLVDQRMQRGDLVSILPACEGTGVLQQLTGDRERPRVPPVAR